MHWISTLFHFLLNFFFLINYILYKKIHYGIISVNAKLLSLCYLHINIEMDNAFKPKMKWQEAVADITCKVAVAVAVRYDAATEAAAPTCLFLYYYYDFPYSRRMFLSSRFLSLIFSIFIYFLLTNFI